MRGRLYDPCFPAIWFRAICSAEGFDAIETYSGRNSEEEARKANHVAGLRTLPSLWGSDCHSKEQLGMAFTEFTNPVHTVDELIEEIRRENCRGMNP